MLENTRDWMIGSYHNLSGINSTFLNLVRHNIYFALSKRYSWNRTPLRTYFRNSCTNSHYTTIPTRTTRHSPSSTHNWLNSDSMIEPSRTNWHRKTLNSSRFRESFERRTRKWQKNSRRWMISKLNWNVSMQFTARSCRKWANGKPERQDRMRRIFLQRRSKKRKHFCIRIHNVKSSTKPNSSN